MEDVNQVIEIVEFDDENISTDTNRVRNVSTVGVEVPLQTVVLNVTLKNAVETGTFDLEVFAEGSFDRRTWSRRFLGAVTVIIGSSPVVPQQRSTTADQTSYPYLRLRAQVEGGSALFSAQFVFSDQ